MSIFYSKKTCGFYDDNLNTDLPGDAVEISSKYHAELLEKQSAGLVIQSDENGYPVAVEHVLTVDEIILKNKSQQQQLINIANEQIIILERALKYNRANEAEKNLLEQLELFTVDVSQLDLFDPELIFPELPKKPIRAFQE